MIKKYFIEINLSSLTANQRERLQGFLGYWKIPHRTKKAVYFPPATDGGRNPFYEGRVEGEQAERIHRDMVLENNRIAEQSDQAERAIRSNPALAAPYGEDDGIMQFDDPYQAMAFLFLKQED